MYFVGNVLVFVNISTKKLTVRAKPSDTIWNVKAKVEEETGISAYCQQLKLAGEPLPLPDDSAILSNNVQLNLDLEIAKLCG